MTGPLVGGVLLLGMLLALAGLVLVDRVRRKTRAEDAAAARRWAEDRQAAPLSPSLTEDGRRTENRNRSSEALGALMAAIAIEEQPGGVGHVAEDESYGFEGEGRRGVM